MRRTSSLVRNEKEMPDTVDGRLWAMFMVDTAPENAQV
jgi:hypothetical protein